MWLTARALTMTGRAIGLTVVRTLLHIAGLAAMFTALRFLPLADAIAMAFVMPFIMLLLGWMVLGSFTAVVLYLVQVLRQAALLS